MRLRALIGEPLVQFLAIGAVLAALTAIVPERPDGATTDPAATIVIGKSRIEQLESLFASTWQRPPTPAEREGLIEAFVREEVLYRAGQALGLGEDDAVVRSRVAQKMAFLLEPAPGEIAPTADDLERHLAAFPDRFRIPARLTFEQIMLDPGTVSGGEGPGADGLLAQLQAGADPAAFGRPSVLPTARRNERSENVARVFGEAFAEALMSAPLGEWSGPVRSSYGAHLVKVAQRVPARAPDLAQVREVVAADWSATRSAEVAEQRFEALKAGYSVTVASPDGSVTDETVADRTRADRAAVDVAD